jgi:hypothetical protein
MRPTARDLAGAAILALGLTVLVVLLVALGIPRAA